MDTRCRINLTVSGRPSVFAEERAATTPSRKSSRKSMSGLKTGKKLARRTQAKKHTPKARAARAQGQRRQARR